MDTQTSSMKMVYTVTDRPDGKSIWTKVGIGSINKDGSLNLKLDAVPVNGKLHVRDYLPYDAWDRERRQNAGDFATDAAPRPRLPPREAPPPELDPIP